jgi:hypothetical protein
MASRTPFTVDDGCYQWSTSIIHLLEIVWSSEGRDGTPETNALVAFATVTLPNSRHYTIRIHGSTNVIGLSKYSQVVQLFCPIILERRFNHSIAISFEYKLGHFHPVPKKS